jgi:hypothetical protein
MLTSPNHPNPPYVISLAAGGKEYGIRLAGKMERSLDDQARVADTMLTLGGGEEYGGDPDVAQIQQKDWTGGRGNDNFHDDNTKFYDAKNLWTTTEGVVHPSLRWRIGKNLRNESRYIGDDIEWQALLGSTRYVSVDFTPDATFDATKIHLWIKRVGTPGTLTVEIQADNGSGQPSAGTDPTATATINDVDDVLSEFWQFTLDTASSLTSGTKMHIVVYSDADDNPASHWEVGVDADTADGYQKSSAGDSWVATSFKLYHRVLGADSKMRYHPFRLDGCWYVATEPDDGTAGKVYILGDRGIATGGANTSLTDSNKSWTANQWADCYVRILDGTGRGQTRKISSNTSTALTVAAAWDINPDATSEYYIYKSDEFTLVSTTLSGPVTSVAVVNNVAYLAQGSGDNIRRLRWDSSTPQHQDVDDGTNKADLLHVYNYYGNRYVFKALHGTAELARAICQDWGTDLRFSDSGTATGGGSNFLRDTNQAWKIDEWKGARLVLTGGTGEGQTFEVYANTTDTIIVNGTFGTNPASGTDYEVYKKESVGDNDYDFTNFYPYQGTLMCFKQDSLWADVQTKPTKVDVDLDSLILDSNGMAVTQSGFFLMYSWAYSVEQQFGTGVEENAQLNDIGPWRGTGLPNGRQGVVSVLKSVMDYVFAGIDGGNDQTSSVHVWNGRGWHEIFRAWTAGQRVRNLFWQSNPGTNPRLWIQVGQDMVYMDFPAKSHNPLNDPDVAYVEEAVFISSYLNMKSHALPKFWRALTATTRGLGGDTTIAIDYQVDDDVGQDGFGYWIHAGNLLESPEDDVPINVGDNRLLRYRLRLQTSDATNPPQVLATVVQGFGRIPDRRVWAILVDVKNVFTDSQGRQGVDSNEFLTWLYNKSNAADGVRMYSQFEHMHDVNVVIRPVYPRRVGYNSVTKQWEGQIRLALQEA